MLMLGFAYMSDFLTRTAKLIPRTKRLKPFPGFATAYHYETEGTDAEEMGNLYVAIEVLTAPKQAESVVDLVIETAGTAYYNTGTSKINLLERFENALKSTNQALANYTNAGNAGWVGRLSAVIAVLADDELHITQAGSAEAYLFRGNITSQITSDLTTKNQQRPINTFANIATGQLQLHDRLVLGTPAFFHEVQQPQLKSILTDNSANTAVQKLSELISQNEESNRVAAIVVEITNPELLALQARPDEPDHIEVGQADKPIEVAKAIALPVAKSIANTSRVMGSKAATQAKNNLLPKAKQAGFGLAAAIRSRLRTRRGQIQLGVLASLIILALLASTIAKQHRQATTAQISEYDAIFSLVTKSEQLLGQGKRSDAQTELAQAQSRLSKLGKAVSENTFDAQLNKHPHPEDDPSSISKLQVKIKDLQTQIEGILTLKTSVLSEFSEFKSSKPTRMVSVGNKLLIIDSQNNSAIYSYDLNAKTLTLANKGNSQIGKVIDSTVSSDNTGAYLLTDKPGIWYIRALDGSLSQISLNIGEWPKGRSIATYNNYLYMLASDSSDLYKFSPTAAGFAAPTSYFKDTSALNGTTALAIDGSIYLTGGPSGLRRYTAGKLDQGQTDIPADLQSPGQILVIDNSDRLLILDSNSHHLGIFTNNPDSIVFAKQIVLGGTKNVTAISTDPKSTTIYALADGKLVSASLPQ